MTGSGSRDLTQAEQSFAAQVEYQFRHEPSARKLQLMQTTRRALLSAPPVDTYTRLERELGTPAEYAARLTARGDNAPPPVRKAPEQIKAHGSGPSTTVWYTVVLAAVALIVVLMIVFM